MGDLSYRFDTKEQLRGAGMTIASVGRFVAKRLANTLESAGLVEGFRIAPPGK